MRAAALIVMTLVLATGCAGSNAMGGGPADGTGGPPSIAPSPALNATRAPLLPADPFALPATDPGRFGDLLAQLRGTPVVVNVWASWCGPCRAEGPDLAEAARTYGDRVQFVGLDILDDRGSARSFIREMGWPYPSVFDAPGAVRDDLGFVGQPVTVFYDADGRQVFVWNGPLTRDLLDAQLARLV